MKRAQHKLPYAEPDPAGSERAGAAKRMRDLATEISRLAPQALTRSNQEEQDHGPEFSANFTKGLKHNDFGLVEDGADYECFVQAINSPDPHLFEKSVPTAESHCVVYNCTPKTGKPFEWRGWESPRAGHAFDLEGPDAGAVGMAPAPRIGSSELAAEMAEVYGLALLRDVPFTEIAKGNGGQLKGSKFGDSTAVLNAQQVVDALNGMAYFQGSGAVSSTPHQADANGFNQFERNRRKARNGPNTELLTTKEAFRGSTKGALSGPYISQFMLIGGKSLKSAGGGSSNYPGRDAAFDIVDGYIPYGSLIVDQRTLTHKNGLDYMTDWCSWLDVQNGADTGALRRYEAKRRFITTPRDLATYVHHDALYEAYLNACLILLSFDAKTSKGFPEPNSSGTRTAFATFGGPHILSLVTEVATRCLKAVRRQKFNYHRRARPEAIGGRLTLCQIGGGEKLGCSAKAFAKTLEEIPLDLKKAIVAHNAAQASDSMSKMRELNCADSGCLPKDIDAKAFAAGNLLLPMAFPEGSPMHPAYGAGHATVAGGCVTVLKAFFEMYEDCHSGKERELRAPDGSPIAFVPTTDGACLEPDETCADELTIQGELDKLAANISIGRNMAGVHYYSDYYDSLRMGERVAVGMLMQQAPTYGETMETSFKSFDGDLITISGEGGSCPNLSILDAAGRPVAPDDWWLRHVSGAEPVLDLQ